MSAWSDRQMRGPRPASLGFDLDVLLPRLLDPDVSEVSAGQYQVDIPTAAPFAFDGATVSLRWFVDEGPCAG